VVTFIALGLWVKTLDLAVSTMAVYASLPSCGHRRGAPISLGIASVASVPIFGFSCIFFLSLIFFVRGSRHLLVSVRPRVAFFIKRGESLFQGRSERISHQYEELPDTSRVIGG
jgi:hypothetical protein